MTHRLTIIAPDGSRTSQEFPKSPSLDTLQAAVGGCIEALNWSSFEGKRCEAYCHEEGKLEGLPVNREATRLYREQLGKRGFAAGPDGADFLVGPIALVQKIS